MSREAFEKWYSENICTLAEFETDADGYYEDSTEQVAFRAWQASNKKLRAELAKAQVVPEYPMQPMQNKRFEANPIIENFIEDLNAVAIWCQLNDIDGKYQEQLAQLIGYSLNGYGELSYVSDESYDRAVKSLQGETV